MNLEDMPPVGGSSNFASRVPKLDSGKKLKVPGPGTYSHSESFREQVRGGERRRRVEEEERGEGRRRLGAVILIGMT